MAQPLFFQPDVQFEKVSAETQLPDDPNQWPNEILDEIYRQVPYLADFDIDVNMDRVDAERAFGFGHVLVGSKTEAPQQASSEELANAGVRQVRVPIIIREGRLQPFDVLVTDDSRMMPLTEQRLRQAVFRPHTFDVTGKTPGDQSMIGQLYPPFRQNHGFGGSGMAVGGSMDGKMASLATPLTAMLAMCNESDIEEFAEAVKDSGLKLAFVNNSAAHDAISKIGSAQPASLDKTAAALMHYIKPTILQLCKEGSSYVLKTASRLTWEPHTEAGLDRGEVVRRCGEKVVLAADMTGAVTVAEDEGVVGPSATPQTELVEETGLYQVTTLDGQTIEGAVFANLLDMDGSAKPLSMFTDGQRSAVQADIAGVPKGPLPPIEGLVPADQASGFGAFLAMEAGMPVATVPIEVKGRVNTGEGSSFVAQTFDGRPIEVSVQPHIQTLTPFDEQVLIPSTWQWMPLGETSELTLHGAPEDAAKMASAGSHLTTVEIRGGGADCFSLSGAPIEKLAREDRSFLTQHEALFLLGGFGANLEHAKAKLAEASTGFRPVPVLVRGVKVAEEVRGEAMLRAEDYLSRAPVFRHRLWKEASVIPDPVAVDTILSLGFINPENVAAFIGYLPVLDEAQCRMCELLIASRLGMSHVPGPALEKAIRATESVISGVKEMAFQE